MIHFKKILVPTDFSSGSRVAYKYAGYLAKHFDGTIDFIHVVPSLKYLAESIGNMGLPLDMEKDIYPHLVKRAKEHCEDDIRQFIAENHRGNSLILVDRKPSDDIIEIAREDHYDVVVMGARGAHDDGLLKWGGITEKVIRYSSVPVISVPGKMPKEGISRILVPTDMSDISFNGLPFAASLAAAVDAEITVLHVLELYGSTSENIPRDQGKNELEALDSLLLDKIDKALQEAGSVRARLEKEPYQLFDNLIIDVDGEEHVIKLHTKIVKGVSAHYEIVDFASDNMDLIIMGTHGRSGLKHLLLGSTTEKVAEYSPIPVFTFRSRNLPE